MRKILFLSYLLLSTHTSADISIDATKRTCTISSEEIMKEVFFSQSEDQNDLYYVRGSFYFDKDITIDCYYDYLNKQGNMKVAKDTWLLNLPIPIILMKVNGSFGSNGEVVVANEVMVNFSKLTEKDKFIFYFSGDHMSFIAKVELDVIYDRNTAHIKNIEIEYIEEEFFNFQY